MTKFKYKNIVTEKIIKQITLMYQNRYIPSHIEISKDLYDLILDEQIEGDVELETDKLFGLELRILDNEKSVFNIPAKYKIDL